MFTKNESKMKSLHNQLASKTNVSKQNAEQEPYHLGNNLSRGAHAVVQEQCHSEAENLPRA
jgi:hypothetical protein